METISLRAENRKNVREYQIPKNIGALAQMKSGWKPKECLSRISSKLIDKGTETFLPS